jgi:hypothetical protein
VDEVGGIRANLVAHVRQVLDPLFLLFDFKQIGEKVYADIVNRFVAGDVS